MWLTLYQHASILSTHQVSFSLSPPPFLRFYPPHIMFHLRTLLSLVLATASVATATIVCETTPITKGTLAVIPHNPHGEFDASRTGPLLSQKADGTFEAGGNASTLIWTFPCTSDYLKIDDGFQTKIPQSRYGLLVIADGPSTSPTPDSRCLAVQFDEGTEDSGTLVSQPCSFEDDESQKGQFFSLWKTKKPEPYLQFERFQGQNNPYFYGGGFSVSYANISAVRMIYSEDLNLLTLVKPRK